MKHRLEQSGAQREIPTAVAGEQVPGRVVRPLTPDQRRADIKAFGREIRDSKQSAADFLRRAGLIDESGQLTEPYRR
jgi:hypothetical protein